MLSLYRTAAHPHYYPGDVLLRKADTYTFDGIILFYINRQILYFCSFSFSRLHPIRNHHPQLFRPNHVALTGSVITIVSHHNMSHVASTNLKSSSFSIISIVMCRYVCIAFSSMQDIELLSDKYDYSLRVGCGCRWSGQLM